MPRYPIDRATNFIVEDESWQVVEYDHTSVPGTIYLSLTENKVNMIYDDLVNDIADTDKLAIYNVVTPEPTQTFVLGSTIQLQFTLMKNGVPCTEEMEYISQNRAIVSMEDDELIAAGVGETDILVRLKAYPQFSTMVHVRVDDTTAFSAYIEGVDKIRLDREATYTLIGSEEITRTVEFEINNPELATITLKEGAQCIIKANKKNLLGDIVLTATYNDITYTKTISIIPLW